MNIYKSYSLQYIYSENFQVSFYIFLFLLIISPFMFQIQ